MNSISTKTNDQWQDYKFSDLCKITRGASPRPIHEWVTQSGGMPWVKISDATASNSRYLSKTKEQIKLDAVRMSVQVHPGDLIVSNSATPGIPKFLTIDACIHDGWLLLRDIKDTTTKEYLYYLLVSIREGLLQLGNGSIFTNLKTDILKNYPVKIPNKELQKLIVSILSLIDTKIDLLNNQNNLFENLANTLFSKLINENLKNVGQMSDVIELVYGKGLTEINRIPGEYPVVGSSGITGTHSEYLVKGPGLVVGRKGTVGSVYYLYNNFYPIDTTFYVKDKLGLKHLYFYYFLIKRQDFISLSSDSAVPGLNRNIALSSEVVIPSKDDIIIYNDLVDPMFRKIDINKNQISTLTNLRNKLLPKLMNGEIKLN